MSVDEAENSIQLTNREDYDLVADTNLNKNIEMNDYLRLDIFLNFLSRSQYFVLKGEGLRRTLLKS